MKSPEFENAAGLTSASGEVSLLHVRWRATHSHMLCGLGTCRQMSRRHLALGEIGRIERSLFMPDWIENPRLRVECEAGLTRSERALVGSGGLHPIGPDTRHRNLWAQAAT